VADRYPEVVARIETYMKSARTESEHWSAEEAVKTSKFQKVKKSKRR